MDRLSRDQLRGLNSKKRARGAPSHKSYFDPNEEQVQPEVKDKQSKILLDSEEDEEEYQEDLEGEEYEDNEGDDEDEDSEEDGDGDDEDSEDNEDVEVSKKTRNTQPRTAVSMKRKAQFPDCMGDW